MIRCDNLGVTTGLTGSGIVTGNLMSVMRAAWLRNSYVVAFDTRNSEVEVPDIIL